MNNKALSDKTFVLMTKQGYRCWISKQQVEALRTELLKDKKFIFLDDCFFNASDISFILPAAAIEREDRIKKGQWQCSFGYWHDKNQECGHSLQGL